MREFTRAGKQASSVLPLTTGARSISVTNIDLLPTTTTCLPTEPLAGQPWESLAFPPEEITSSSLLWATSLQLSSTRQWRRYLGSMARISRQSINRDPVFLRPVLIQHLTLALE